MIFSETTSNKSKNYIKRVEIMIEDTRGSLDEDDNVPPYLPDTSAGSSISSALEVN